MHFTSYFKAFINAFLELCEIFGKFKTLFWTLIFLIGFLSTVNFFDYSHYIDWIKPYHNVMLFFFVTVVVYISGYKAWLRLYLDLEKNNSGQVLINIEEASVSVGSSTMGVKINTLRMDFSLYLRNKYNHSVKLEEINIKSAFSKMGLNSYDPLKYSDSMPSKDILPYSSFKIKFSTTIEINDLSLKAQLELIRDLQFNDEFFIVNFYSINGNDSSKVNFIINNEKAIKSIMSNQMGFDKNIVNSVFTTDKSRHL
ncbi:hypothetical protein [Erwinia mallotivora]|uniref:hypothetical protein n=1 Tax=Erwinia mallotivora TaxID=69222 RepID=UPI0021BE976A|nr:hypothetical protein [Erwinia mallotivora]